MLNEKCYLCKKEDWLYDVKHDDNDSFDYLDSLSCPDGYALVCEECYDKHFRNSSKFDALMY